MASWSKCRPLNGSSAVTPAIIPYPTETHLEFAPEPSGSCLTASFDQRIPALVSMRILISGSLSSRPGAFAVLAAIVSRGFGKGVPISHRRYSRKQNESIVSGFKTDLKSGTIQELFDSMSKYFVIALVSVVCPIWAQSGNPAITTGQYDANRSSANLDETTLSTSNVTASQFGKLFSWRVDGWIFAQPLYVPGVPIQGGPGKNVVYVATMNNSIYAFDADQPSTTPLWHLKLEPATTGAAANGCPNVGGTGQMGILSTPVIDPATNTLYAVSVTPTGVSSSAPHGIGYVYHLHAVDITTGLDKPGSPIQIQASVAGTGYGYDSVNGRVYLGPKSTESQRTSLLLANGAVYAGFGNCGGDGDPWHGWVVAYNTSDLSQKAVFNSTPNAGQGGIWQSGRGLATDVTGDIYFNTGNLSPYNSTDAGLTTGNSTTDAQKGNYPMRFVQLNAAGQFLGSYPPADYAALNTDDLDFSSSGPLVIPGRNLLVTGGKQGIMYLFNSSNLSTPLQSFQATGNSACNLSFDGCNQIHDLAFWNNTLYVWGGYDVLRAYAFSPSTNQFNPTPTSKNSISTQKPPASFAVSANGSAPGTGVLWAVLPDSSVHAFDASNVASELWNSNQDSSRDGLPSYPKFTEPTVANGRVYVATHSNQVVAYGLLSDFALSTSAPSLTASQNSTATVTVNLTALKTLSSPVTLGVSGLPAGATASFTPTALSTSGSSTLKITTSGSTPTGTYNLIVTGTTGSIMRSASLSFIVTTATPDTTPPQWTCCTYAFEGTSTVLGFTAWDTQSGLASIQAVQQVNAQVSIPSFQPGTTSTVNFTETQSGTSSYVEFKLTDVAGNVTYIDPISVDAARASGQPLGYPMKNVTPDVGVLTITNGSPGLKNVRIEISNGPDTIKIQVAGLKDGEVRVLDLTSDLQGGGSAVIITPLGKPGGTAMFVFASSPMTGSPQ